MGLLSCYLRFEKKILLSNKIKQKQKDKQTNIKLSVKGGMGFGGLAVILIIGFLQL